MKVKINKNLFRVDSNHWVITSDERPKSGDYCLDGDELFYPYEEGDVPVEDFKKIIGTINFKLEDIPYIEISLNNNDGYSEEDMKRAFRYYAYASISQQPRNDKELDEDFNKFLESFSNNPSKIKEIEFISKDISWFDNEEEQWMYGYKLKTIHDPAHKAGRLIIKNIKFNG